MLVIIFFNFSLLLQMMLKSHELNALIANQAQKQMGIKHRKITPLAPQVNGQAESFMKPLAKVIRSAISEGKCWKQELNKFLRNYRSTPHSTTGKPPSVLMFNRNNACRLPKLYNNAREFDLIEVITKDKQAKEKAKSYTDKRRRAKEIELKIGDEVIAKQKRNSKWKTRFGEELFVVTGIKGSMITIESKDKEKCFTRDRSWFKCKTWKEDDEYINVRSNENGTFENHGDRERVTSSPELTTNITDQIIDGTTSNTDSTTATDNNQTSRKSQRQRFSRQHYQAGEGGMERISK